MRSLRLDPELDEKIQRAAAINGESVSQFIRNAAKERADEILTVRPSDRFADVTGIVHGGGGQARRSGAAFTDALAKSRSGG
jgi:hypothetical protein